MDAASFINYKQGDSLYERARRCLTCSDGGLKPDRTASSEVKSCMYSKEQTACFPREIFDCGANDDLLLLEALVVLYDRAQVCGMA
jgi:hypothetical protein